MRLRPRFVFGSAFWAYATCFVAGGATVALASFAFQHGTGRVAKSSPMHGLHLAHKAAAAHPATARPHGTAALEKKPAEPIVLARVDASEQAAEPVASDAAPSPDADLDPGLSTKPWEPERSDTYRTVCVRLCDGSYTPISFATTKSKLKADAAKCEAGCGSPSRMFYAPAGSGELERMRDLNGDGYVDLPNAYKFRTSYDPACTCRAHPWQEASILRHRQLAAAQAQERSVSSSSQTVAQTAVPRETSAGQASMGRRAGLSARSPVVVTGSVQRSLPAEVAASVDLPLQAGSQGLSVVQTATKPGDAGGDAKAAKARAAQLKAKHRAARKDMKAPAPGGGVYVTARDLRTNVKGNARAQRAFDAQDFWRMSFWEPH